MISLDNFESGSFFSLMAFVLGEPEDILMAAWRLDPRIITIRLTRFAGLVKPNQHVHFCTLEVHYDQKIRIAGSRDLDWCEWIHSTRPPGVRYIDRYHFRPTERQQLRWYRKLVATYGART